MRRTPDPRRDSYFTTQPPNAPEGEGAEISWNGMQTRVTYELLERGQIQDLTIQRLYTFFLYPQHACRKSRD